jgi:hypothetical protein
MPRLQHRVGLAADDVAGEGAGLIVHVDVALFPQEAAEQSNGRDGVDRPRIEIVDQRQAFDDVVEAHPDRPAPRYPGVENQVAELRFAEDVPRARCIDIDVEDALIRGFGDHRAPDIEPLFIFARSME